MTKIKCEYCKQSFVSRGNLKRHKENDTNCKKTTKIYKNEKTYNVTFVLNCLYQNLILKNIKRIIALADQSKQKSFLKPVLLIITTMMLLKPYHQWL